jgi:hypothetical protein
MMLRAAMVSLLGHEVIAALANPDRANVGVFVSRAPGLEVLALAHQLRVLQRSWSLRLPFANPDCAVRRWIGGRKRHEFGTPRPEIAQLWKPDGRKVQSSERLETV